MPIVKALKNFQGLKEEGGFVYRGTEIEVDDERHAALAKNGLVAPPEAKRAPDPQNKMAPDAANKAVATPSKDITSANLVRPPQTKVSIDDPKAAEKLVEGRPLPLTGGQTGAGNAPSSQPPARQLQRRGSNKPEDKRGS